MLSSTTELDYYILTPDFVYDAMGIGFSWDGGKLKPTTFEGVQIISIFVNRAAYPPQLNIQFALPIYQITTEPIYLVRRDTRQGVMFGPRTPTSTQVQIVLFAQQKIITPLDQGKQLQLYISTTPPTFSWENMKDPSPDSSGGGGAN